MKIEQVNEFADILDKRVKAIEETIDSHFNLVVPSIMAAERQKFERYQELVPGLLNKFLRTISYHDKLAYLQENKKDLIQANKEQIENRTGKQTILRMRGSMDDSLS